MPEIADPPPLNAIVESDDWKTLAPEDRTKIVDGWKSDVIAKAKELPDWSPDHEIAIHNAGADALQGKPIGSFAQDASFGDMLAVKDATSPEAIGPQSDVYGAAYQSFEPSQSADPNESIGHIALSAIETPLVKLPRPEGDGVVAGTVRGLETLAEGLTTVENLGLMATIGGAPRAIQKVASSAFAAMLLKNAPEQASAVLEAKTSGERAERLVEAAGSLAMGGMALGHAGGRMAGGGLLKGETPKTTARKGSADISSASEAIGMARIFASDAAKTLEAQAGDMARTLIENDALNAQTKTESLPAVPPSDQGLRLPEAKVEQPTTERTVTTDEIQKEGQGRQEVLSPPAEIAPDVPPVAEPPVAELKVGDTIEAQSHQIKGLVHKGRVTSVEGNEIVMVNQDNAPVLVLRENVKSAAPEPPVASPAAKAGEGGATPSAEMTPDESPLAFPDRQFSRERRADKGQWLENNIPSEQLSNTAETGPTGTITWSSKKRFSSSAEYGVATDTETSSVFVTKDGRLAALNPNNDLVHIIPWTDSRVTLSAELVDRYGIKPPEGWTQRGDLWHPPEAKPTPAAPAAPEPAPTYQGGPGAMGPVEAGEMSSGQKRIGGYNADVEARQKARGQTPTLSEARKEDPVTFENAMAVIEKDPAAPEKLVERIHEDPKKPLTDEEQQMLTWRRADLENRMAQESERAVDSNLSADEQAVHQSSAEFLESQLLRTEQANRMAGTASGRSLRSRQLEMNDDYTFAGLMMRRRKLTGEVVPPDVRAQLAEKAKAIERLQKQVEELDALAKEDAIKIENARIMEATIKELREENAKKVPYSKQVFDIAEGIVKRWDTERDAARKEHLRSMGKLSANPIPTETIKWLALELRSKVARIGLDFSKASVDLIAELGPDIQPFLQKAWVKMVSLIDSEKTGGKVKKLIKEGVEKPKKGEKLPADIGARAKAEASAGLELSSKTAYEAVRAVINSGVKGELEIMKAAHDLLKQAYPELTPGELDIAFSEYGKAKYPSTEATKVELSKLRRLRQMQAAIDDVKRRGETAKSGLQRAKADADVRKRQQELKDAIEEYGKEVPTSPEQLANRERARLTRAENAIADLDRELQTGEARIKAEPAMPSKELEQLQSELAAMRELKKEIEDAKNPPPTAEEKYNATRAKGIERQIAAAEARLKAGDFAPRPKKVSPALTKANLDALAKLEAKKNEIRRGEERYRLENRTKMRKIWDGIRQTNLARTNIISSLDFSAPRQGLVYLLTSSTRIATQPGMVLRPFAKMFQAFSSQKLSDRINQEINARPNRKNGVDKQSGVQFQDPDNTSFTRGEENAHSVLDEWAQKSFRGTTPLKTAGKAVPLAAAKAVHMSNRAFVTFLNAARAELLDHLLKVNFKDRAPTPTELRLVGDMVNLSTGRGNMHHRSSTAISMAGLWSPHLLVSRLQLLTGQPLVGSIVRGEGRAAKIVTKEYARIIAAGYILYQTSRMFSDDEEKESTSSDFGKIIRKGEGGDTRIDLWGGFQQVTVLEERFRNRESTNLDGETRKLSGRELLLTGAKFYRSKLRPDVALGADILLGENYKGDKTTVGTVAKSLVPIPISAGELLPLIKAHGLSEAAALQAIQLFGAGVSNYADDEKADKPRPR